MREAREQTLNPKSSPAVAGSRRRILWVIVLAAVGAVLIGCAYVYRHYYVSMSVGSGPAGPAVPRGAFEETWTRRKVFLLGIGDSITEGYGASPGHAYFDRLVRNPEDEFPDMRGICLTNVLPNLTVRNMATSGSTSLDHLADQARRFKTQPPDVLGIVVMTTGGNDVIHDYGRSPPKEGAMYGATFEQAKPWIKSFEKRLNAMLDLIEKSFPGGCVIFLANIYDPTDGIGDAQNAGLPHWPDAVAILAAYNDVISRCAREKESVHLVDIHSAFLGHGIHAAQFWREHYREEDPHFWFCEILEDPNDRGYDAVRRLFLLELIAAREEIRKMPMPENAGLDAFVERTRTELPPGQRLNRKWVQDASVIVKGTYARSAYDPISFRDGTSTALERSTFTVEEVLRGEIAVDTFDANLATNDEQRFPRDYVPGETYLIFMKPFRRSSARLQEAATVFNVFTQVGSDELVAIVKLSQAEAKPAAGE